MVHLLKKKELIIENDYTTLIAFLAKKEDTEEIFNSKEIVFLIENSIINNN